MRRPARVKIEFFAPLLNLPLAAAFIYLIVDNRGYWEMINGIAAGVFWGWQLNYMASWLALAIGVAATTVVLLGLGLRDVTALHRPAVAVLSPALLGVMTSLLAVVLSVNERVNLDYLFFTLGPAGGLATYMGVTVGILGVLALLGLGSRQLLGMPRPGDLATNTHPAGEHARARSQKSPNPAWHPRLVVGAATTSTVVVAIILWALVASYPVTATYWGNGEALFTRYVPWSHPGALLWGIGAGMAGAGGVAYLLGKRHDAPRPGGGRALRLFIAGGAILQVGGVAWLGTRVAGWVGATHAGLTVIVVGILVAGSLVSLAPVLARGARALYARVESVSWRRGVVVGATLALVGAPYWVIFYHPLASGPPAVDLPSPTRLVPVDGVAVPFQGTTAYPSFETQPSTRRSYLNLSGPWRYHHEGGSHPQSLSPRTAPVLSAISAGQHEVTFDDSKWPTMLVPGAVNHYEDPDPYFGVTWFRRWVEVPATLAGHAMILKCLGVNYVCDAWIDGQHVGYHEGGFTSFAFDVTGLLAPGRHLVALRVDNPAWGGMFNDRIVPDGCDFFNHGGLVRELHVEATPPVAVVRADVRVREVTTADHHVGNVTVDLEVVVRHSHGATAGRDGPGATVTVDVSVCPLQFPEGDAPALQSRETWQYANTSALVATARRAIPVPRGNAGGDSPDTSSPGASHAATTVRLALTHVALWSTKRPRLHAVFVNLTTGNLSDAFCTQTGFRAFNISGTALHLNGAPLKLAGVSYHEQYPRPTGRTLSDAQYSTDLALIQATGSNWWRGSYPFHPNAYLFSDRLGLACWEEAPVFWVNEADVVQARARGYYAGLWVEVLYRDVNRPSILFWSAGNEPWAQQAWYDYVADTKAFLERHDPTRVLSFACVSSHDWTPAFHELAVVTPNTYGGTFDGVLGDFYGEMSRQVGRFAARNPGKPLISMEWGYWRGAGTNDSEQVRCFEEGFRALTEHPNCQGVTWWLAFDYYGRDYHNSMGIYNHARTWASPTLPVMRAAYTNYTRANL